eukprot:TRINITY_DN1958_c0_g2_i5.p1 TRINITY_DN1958_c0_g2~~TRINITY_DN1958_c0_g2_i5.p1  ORF type:complete len:121 (+),score=23.47 TRINITY_DN1958_c0_g2_i5:216-578(+)
MTFAAGYNFIRLSGPTIEWLDNVVGVYTWLVSVVIWLLWTLRQYTKLSHQRDKLLKNEGRTKALEKVQFELKTTALLGLNLFCDLQLAVYWMYGFWTSKMVGVFGTTAALASLYSKWISQ